MVYFEESQRPHEFRRNTGLRLAILGLCLVFSTHASAKGWTVGQGTILTSADLGESWDHQTSPTTAILNAVHFKDNETGWIAGGQTILKTTDGGIFWITKYNGGAVLRSIWFPIPTTGWAVGSMGTILKSTDSGENWLPQSSGVGADLNSIYCVSATACWAAGGQVILRTINGGLTWANTYSGGAVLRSVFFADATTGWVVGSTGTILKTTNGGLNWLPQTSNVSTELNSVFFADASIGFVAGPQVILKTTDGGAHWTNQYSGGAALHDVFFLDRNIGWAVGTGGVVLKTIDGGETWLAKTTGSSITLNAVHFVECDDADSDGYYLQSGCGTLLDCDDSSSQDHPGATEIPGNNDDEDCDGQEECFNDADGDGYGTDTPRISTDTDCFDANESTTSNDCNDNSATVYPGALEIVANGIDDDCDGVDSCYQDSDNDGYGTSIVIDSDDIDCADPYESANSTDCNDSSSSVYPGAPELVNNGIDEDCNGVDSCYQDNDDDNYGTPTIIDSDDLDCADSYEATNTGDCDDTIAMCTTDCGDEDSSGVSDCAEGPSPPANLRASWAGGDSAGTLRLIWDPVPLALGYVVYVGQGPRDYTRSIDVGNTTNTVVQALPDCTLSYFAVAAYNSLARSSLSNEVSSWPTPFIGELSPTSLRQGSEDTVIVTGANFQPGYEAGFRDVPTDIDGTPLVYLDSWEFRSCTQAQSLVTVAPTVQGARAAPVGSLNIELEVSGYAPDYQRYSFEVTFEVVFDVERVDLNQSVEETIGRVDGRDLFWLAYSFGTGEWDLDYFPAADLDGDGCIDGVDLAYLAAFFGLCWDGTTWTGAACR